MSQNLYALVMVGHEPADPFAWKKVRPFPDLAGAEEYLLRHVDYQLQQYRQVLPLNRPRAEAQEREGIVLKGFSCEDAECGQAAGIRMRLDVYIRGNFLVGEPALPGDTDLSDYPQPPHGVPILFAVDEETTVRIRI